MKLRGCGTALVTPFKQDGSIDEPALRELVRWQVESGIDFLVPCGTTGETPTLSHDEWLRVVDLTIAAVEGRVPIMAGATSNNTREAVAKAKEISSRSGVDYILTATPYYNKPTQEGIYQHFKAIADASAKPLVLYNIAGRTGTNIETSTLLRLAEIPNIIAVKEASGNISQIAEVCASVPEDFLVFSGDDAVTLARNRPRWRRHHFCRVKRNSGGDGAHDAGGALQQVGCVATPFPKVSTAHAGQFHGVKSWTRKGGARYDGPHGRGTASAAGPHEERESCQAGENRSRGWVVAVATGSALNS